MDPSQISQIMVNLCVNARDAINGVGSITIQTENSAIDALYASESVEVAPGDYVLLTISDDGSGMSKEVLAHLFVPFFTTKKVGKGTGLGLATVYGIVQQNHGHIRVYSEIGLGTTFKIYLPRHFDAPEPAPETPTDEIPHGKGERVLLVEDEPAVLAMSAESLQKLGYTVLPAATSADALAIASEHEDVIDLLITDVVMPEINGRRLAEQIAMHRPHIKRIFMSGYPADIVSQRAVFSGDEHFLPKPFTLFQLATTVRRVLDADER
jgi:CheY-like chemotaxis protein